jgi:hypothetical protein
VPPSSLDLKHSHTITSRVDHRVVTDVPGAGAYAPKFPLPEGPKFTVHGPPSRSDWLAPSEATPGPGEYTPQQAASRAIGVSFTGHARDARRTTARLAPRNADVLVAIGQIVLSLKKCPDGPDEARKYIFTHTDLRQVVVSIVDIVLEQKPERPVEYVRGMFREMQEARDAGKPKVVVNPEENDNLAWM